MAERYDEELFLGFLEGDLTPEQIAQFEKVLVDDARLRNLVAQLVLDRHRTRNMGVEKAPAELMERVNQRLERRMLLDSPAAAEAAVVTPVRRFHLGRVAAYSGVAAMVALVAILILHTLNGPSSSDLSGTGRRAGGPMAAAVPQDEEGRAAGSRNPMAQLKSASNVKAGSEDASDGAIDRPGRPGDRRGMVGLPGRPPMPPDVAERSPLIKARREDAKRGITPFTRDIVEKLTGIKTRPQAPGRSEEFRLTYSSSSPVADVIAPDLEQMVDESRRVESAGGTVQDSGLRVVIRAASMAQSEQAIRSWAKEHDVRIVSPAELAAQKQVFAFAKKRPAALDELAGEKKDAGDAAAQIADGDPQMVLFMTGGQLPELVSHLNLKAGQSVTVAQEPGAEAQWQAAPNTAMEVPAATQPAAMAKASRENNLTSGAGWVSPSAGGGGAGTGGRGGASVNATPPSAAAPAAATAEPTGKSEESAEDAMIREAIKAMKSAPQLNEGQNSPALSPFAHVAVPIYIVADEAAGAAGAKPK